MTVTQFLILAAVLAFYIITVPPASSDDAPACNAPCTFNTITGEMDCPCEPRDTIPGPGARGGLGRR